MIESRLGSHSEVPQTRCRASALSPAPARTATGGGGASTSLGIPAEGRPGPGGWGLFSPQGAPYLPLAGGDLENKHRKGYEMPLLPWHTVELCFVFTDKTLGQYKIRTKKY